MAIENMQFYQPITNIFFSPTDPSPQKKKMATGDYITSALMKRTEIGDGYSQDHNIPFKKRKTSYENIAASTSVQSSLTDVDEFMIVLQAMLQNCEPTQTVSILKPLSTTDAKYMNIVIRFSDGYISYDMLQKMRNIKAEQFCKMHVEDHTNDDKYKGLHVHMKMFRANKIGTGTMIQKHSRLNKHSMNTDKVVAFCKERLCVKTVQDTGEKTKVLHPVDRLVNVCSSLLFNMAKTQPIFSLSAEETDEKGMVVLHYTGLKKYKWEVLYQIKNADNNLIYDIGIVKNELFVFLKHRK